MAVRYFYILLLVKPPAVKIQELDDFLPLVPMPKLLRLSESCGEIFCLLTFPHFGYLAEGSFDSVPIPRESKVFISLSLFCICLFGVLIEFVSRKLMEASVYHWSMCLVHERSLTSPDRVSRIEWRLKGQMSNRWKRWIMRNYVLSFLSNSRYVSNHHLCIYKFTYTILLCGIHNDATHSLYDPILVIKPLVEALLSPGSHL